MESCNHCDITDTPAPSATVRWGVYHSAELRRLILDRADVETARTCARLCRTYFQDAVEYGWREGPNIRFLVNVFALPPNANFSEVRHPFSTVI